ncbi:hypothetical protein KJA13_03925 [Patescibacteria group bacterium]|nr:hypothetical protein [Patescibacteria group bacterium]
MLSGIVRGFTSGLKLKEYDLLLCYYEKGELDWITLIKDQDEIGELIFKKHEENNNYWKNELEDWLKIKKEIEDTFKKFKKKDLSGVNNEELVTDIKKYTELQWKARKTSSLMDPFIFYTEKKLPELLSNFARENPKFDINKAVEIITRPEEPLFLNEFELDLIKIAKEIKTEEDIKKTDIYNKIQEHLDKFCWIKVESFFGAKEYTFEDVKAHLRDLLKSNLREEEKKNKIWIDNRKIRKDYISKYKFNEEILAVAELSPLFAKWQDLRKENSVMTTYLDSKYLKELSKRTRINEDDLAYLDYSELEDFIKGNFDISLLKKRKQGSLFVFQKDKFKVFYKDEIEKIINKILRSEKEEISEFPGTIASSGKAAGAVKIVIRQEDISKFEKGDILVSTMTRPEHAPAIKKAAAIVTNEGGITCHAAIVSRELGIPCIIGTKIATRALKDGDLVEVDTNKGVVKIIKKRNK